VRLDPVDVDQVHAAARSETEWLELRNKSDLEPSLIDLLSEATAVSRDSAP
jgi:hypothetical protein